MIQWAAYVIVIAILVMTVLSPPAVTQFQYYTTLMAFSILLVINILWNDLERLFSRKDIGSWVLLLVSSVLSFYALAVGHTFQAVYLIFMIAAQANAMLPAVPALAFSVVLTGLFLGMMPLLGVPRAEMQSLSLGVLIGMTFAITLSQVLYRYIEQSERMSRLLEELRQANNALIEARQKEKELTIAEERVRVARDLHDGLGHHLTALSIQLQAAEKLVRTNPEVAAETIRNSRGEVQAALKEVRQSVAALREAPVDFHDLPLAIRILVEETGRRSDLRASFSLSGEPTELSPASAMTLYRTAQEGLTNIQKHGLGAQEIRVHLTYDPLWVRLAIEDDGTNPQEYRESAGFGLAGLRERAYLLKGNIQCGPGPQGGFFVTIELPLREDAE
jgi:signal transduction histidine kinase